MFSVFPGNTSAAKGGGTMQQFSCKTKIYFGDGALEVLRTLPQRRVFLVTDRFFHESGTAERIGRMVPDCTLDIFSQVQPNPTVEQAAAGVAQLQQTPADLLIALGGGSAIDCAKAIRCMAGTTMQFAVIPTTSGTGSEVTSFSILTHNDVKIPLIDNQLLPDLAILDSSLLQGLPKGLVADAGFDALVHALEAVVSTGANGFTDALATHAFDTILRLLPASFQGDTSVRAQVHIAACMAGLAFDQAGLGICHALAHALGGMFHTAHGKLNAVLIPAVLDFNSKNALGAYAALSRRCGLSGTADTMRYRALRAALLHLRRSLQLPESLAQLDISPTPAQLTQLVQAALADPCCKTNPRPVNAENLRGILQTVAYG